MKDPTLPILYQADFAVTLGHARDMGGADLVLTSPPYDDARTYGAGVNWTFPDYQRLGDATFQAIKPGGWCLMVLDGPVREWRPGFGTERSFTPWRVMLDWAERVGFRVPDRLIYGRTGAVGRFAGRFRNDFEPLLWFQRPSGGGWFCSEALKERTTPWERRHRGIRMADGGMYRRPTTGETGVANRGTIWWYQCGSNQDLEGEATNHPARFDSRLARDVILCFSAPSALVCDPFVGSGTTAAEALKAGRRFVGGDLLCRPDDGKPWIEVTRERCARATAQQPLFGRATG